MPSKRPGPQLSHPVTRDGTPIPFYPKGNRIVVERLDPEAEMGGLIVPDVAKVQMGLATLLAAGLGALEKMRDEGYEIGDTIALAKYSGLYWEWQPEGTTSMVDRHKVDIANVEDILGGKEIADKLIDGRLGIKLYEPEGGGAPEYRFIEQIGLKVVNDKE